MDYDELKTKNEKERYILLDLTVLQPPIRTSVYSDLELSINRKFNDTDNYLWLPDEYDAPQAYFYINKGKTATSEKYSKEEFKLVRIEDRKLRDLLHKFLNDYHQNIYLFQNRYGKPISTDKIT